MRMQYVVRTYTGTVVRTYEIDNGTIRQVDEKPANTRSVAQATMDGRFIDETLDDD